MARALSPQDKLALALTSAGSMRQLAALMGVTHQKIGRWLREGQDGGVKRIPDAALPEIDFAFSLHKEIAKDQARANHLPYTADAPVFVTRPRRTKRDPKTGEGMQGERMIVSHTGFLSPDLRERVIASMHRSGQFIAVSVRSLANLYSYLDIQQRYAATQSGRKIFKLSMLQPFRAREIADPGSNARAPIATKKENISAGSDIGVAMEGIRQKLRQKHEPHSAPNDVGTELIFQTTYRQFDTWGKSAAPVEQSKPRRSPRRSKSGIRDRR
jgi:transposase-like protein